VVSSPPMRRLLRWLVNGLCLLSLLACVGTGWLWWHGCRKQGNKAVVRLRGERYELRSRGGRVTVWGLQAGDPKREQALRRWIAQQSQVRDVQWGAEFDDRTPPDARPLAGFGPLLVYELVHHQDPDGLPPPGSGGGYRPLVEALGDPDHFAIAHVVLVMAWKDQNDPRFDTSIGREDPTVRLDPRLRRIEGTYYGLWVGLPDGGKNWKRGDPFARADAGVKDNFVGPASGYDPGQIPVLREMWVEFLSAPLVDWPQWPLTAAAAVPPLLWLALRARRLLILRCRRRLGLCLRCGYDLTGNASGVCSECGQAVQVERWVTA
jgi:hypothetical protein